MPSFELLLPRNGGGHVFVLFEVDQTMHPIFTGKAFDQAVSVFPYTPDQATGYPDVQRSVPLTGEYVNGGELHRDEATARKPSLIPGVS